MLHNKGGLKLRPSPASRPSEYEFGRKARRGGRWRARAGHAVRLRPIHDDASAGFFFLAHIVRIDGESNTVS